MVPASQTLSVWSAEPETMVLPSGEKATESTKALCALCFSALSSSEAATRMGGSDLGEGLEGQCQYTRIPSHLSDKGLEGVSAVTPACGGNPASLSGMPASTGRREQSACFFAGARAGAPHQNAG